MSFVLAAVLALQAGPLPANPHLSPMSFLVGSCWRGTFPDGRQTDTHCFTPMFGGAFLRDVHVVAGAPRPYSGETLYRWDGTQIRFDYYASDGSHSSGVALPTAEGLRFPEETHRTQDGRETTIRSGWTRDGADAYVALTEVRENDGWRTLWRMRFTRAGPAPTP